MSYLCHIVKFICGSDLFATKSPVVYISTALFVGIFESKDETNFLVQKFKFHALRAVAKNILLEC